MKKELPGEWYPLGKKRKELKIDALVAAVMAYDRATLVEVEAPVPAISLL